MFPIATLERKILWATNEGKLEIVRTILNNRVSCVSATDNDGYTPLHRACYENHIDIAKLLIQYGANVNATTEFKWTPLHSASQWTNAYCVALLLQHGANVNARTDGGVWITIRTFNSLFILYGGLQIKHLYTLRPQYRNAVVRQWRYFSTQILILICWITRTKKQQKLLNEADALFQSSRWLTQLSRTISASSIKSVLLEYNVRVWRKSEVLPSRWLL